MNETGETSDYAAPPPPPKRGGWKSVWTPLTSPREFARAVAELGTGLLGEPFVVAGLVLGIVSGAAAAWWLAWPIWAGVLVAAVTTAAVGCLGLFF